MPTVVVPHVETMPLQLADPFLELSNEIEMDGLRGGQIVIACGFEQGVDIGFHGFAEGRELRPETLLGRPLGLVGYGLRKSLQAEAEIVAGLFLR